MIPRQSTAFLAFSVVSWAAALVYGYSTGGDRLGPVLLGWWGGVGDHLGYAVLIGAALLFLLAATVTIVGRDGTDLTAEAQAQLGVAEVTPVEPASDALVYWPFVTAVGMAVIVGMLVLMAFDLGFTLAAAANGTHGCFSCFKFGTGRGTQTLFPLPCPSPGGRGEKIIPPANP